MRTTEQAANPSPGEIIEHYQRAYRQVHGRQAQAMHMFAEWYQINGEMVHRLTLFGEISRLRALAQQQRMAKTDRSVVQRLIAKLRGS